jgi:hypothetical protein
MSKGRGSIVLFGLIVCALALVAAVGIEMMAAWGLTVEFGRTLYQRTEAQIEQERESTSLRSQLSRER